MGDILCTQTVKDKVVLELQVDYPEALQLNGHFKNVYLFSEHSPSTRSKIVKRGRKEATTYFLVPREFRREIKTNQIVTCQRIQTPGKVFFVYAVDRV